MANYYEESLERDLTRIHNKMKEMASLGERALRDGLKALEERSRQLAYSVILRDQKIDEMEREIDRLCLEFLVRQQPGDSALRFVFASIRVNLELARVGDYAESIARQVLKIISMVRFVKLCESGGESPPESGRIVRSEFKVKTENGKV